MELMIELSVSCRKLNVIFFLLLMKLEHHIQEFRSCQDRLAEVRDKYKEGSTGVNDLTRELAQVSEIIILMHTVTKLFYWSGTNFIMSVAQLLKLIIIMLLLGWFGFKLRNYANRVELFGQSFLKALWNYISIEDFGSIIIIITVSGIIYTCNMYW